MSGKPGFVVHYNAFRTEYGSHLTAIGWTVCIGMNPRLEAAEGGGYEFKVDEGGAAGQALDPFCVTCRVEHGAKSVMVTDANGEHHVQVNGVDVVEQSQNKPGSWVLSKPSS